MKKMNNTEEKMNNMETVKSISYEKKDLMKKIMADYHSGDTLKKKEAIAQMVKENEGFIGVMINRFYAPFSAEYYQDLHGEGVLAIIENMDKFDPEKGTATTFFTTHIRHALSQYTNSLVNKSSAYFSGIMNKVRAAISYFEKEQITPTVSDIAFHTGLTVKKVEEAMRRINATDEMRYETEQDLDLAMSEFAQTPEDEYLKKEQTEILANALMQLEPVDREILTLHYGLADGKERSFTVVAGIMQMQVAEVANSVSRSLRILGDTKELNLLYHSSMRKRNDKIVSSGEITLTPSAELYGIYDLLDDEGIDSSADELKGLK